MSYASAIPLPTLSQSLFLNFANTSHVTYHWKDLWPLIGVMHLLKNTFLNFSAFFMWQIVLKIFDHQPLLCISCVPPPTLPLKVFFFLIKTFHVTSLKRPVTTYWFYALTSTLSPTECTFFNYPNILHDISMESFETTRLLLNIFYALPSTLTHTHWGSGLFRSVQDFFFFPTSF